MRLRPATAADAAALAAIYAPYVTDSAVSFETEPPSPEEMGRRLAACGELYPWLVAEEEGTQILGFAYATAFRARPAYRFAVETSVYLQREAAGKGIGASLYRPLLETLVAQGFTQAIAAISLPNPASVRLHERAGFTRAGTYERVGWKFGAWHDVGLWQRGLAPVGDSPAEPRPWAATGLRLG